MTIPTTILGPLGLFVVYCAVLWTLVRTFRGEAISVPLTLLTVFLAGASQVVLLFVTDELMGLRIEKQMPFFVFEMLCWAVSVKLLTKVDLRDAGFIAVIVAVAGFVANKAGFEWTLVGVMEDGADFFGQLVG